MGSKQLITVVLITSASSKSIKGNFELWVNEKFVPGVNLFCCGPSMELAMIGVPTISIIPYVDPPYHNQYFHINHKKYHACEAVDSEYIYLIHDRFIPSPGFFDKITNALSSNDYDFGSVDVDNMDGSPALRELRVKAKFVDMNIVSSLEQPGRIVCNSNDHSSSNHVAVNGGQFFIRSSFRHMLMRPMRWAEMEDDILSHDLLNCNGVWLTDCKLITLIHRVSPSLRRSLFEISKTEIFYALYKVLCNSTAWLFGLKSVGILLDNVSLLKCTGNVMYLVDPLHKSTSTEHLPSSLEKLLARARLVTSGNSWKKIEKRWFGWVLHASIN